jgi:hypothetical protein
VEYSNTSLKGQLAGTAGVSPGETPAFPAKALIGRIAIKIDRHQQVMNKTQRSERTPTCRDRKLLGAGKL